MKRTKIKNDNKKTVTLKNRATRESLIKVILLSQTKEGRQYDGIIDDKEIYNKEEVNKIRKEHLAKKSCTVLREYIKGIEN